MFVEQHQDGRVSLHISATEAKQLLQGRLKHCTIELTAETELTELGKFNWRLGVGFRPHEGMHKYTASLRTPDGWAKTVTFYSQAPTSTVAHEAWVQLLAGLHQWGCLSQVELTYVTEFAFSDNGTPAGGPRRLHLRDADASAVRARVQSPHPGEQVKSFAERFETGERFEIVGEAAPTSDTDAKDQPGEQPAKSVLAVATLRDLLDRQ